mmetsp:Transcript_23240/g.30098  ORF Transcript_23240/g.30098 Transcript_23240/m.30098 type:complete len:298 (+) Transcript_23240:97-990(+)|eukprot:CAMPEP_0197291798 /NCGR_PEP_ID=MMETSP0890-20130614/19120_1 /TAXON_ID=44058 ORGANISM="Aureoumbra lagunensis, Strain CCMP1510" /NCGR_SAMPLE_ID=MMETSP0890 /ASSEMBLY_ACC=CAM_ASM_000533 /LENGTH=297 /DNA_ID=CAMNT_0042765181 /DNA_START=31 /DNA_END=924 /DNA_ORIENTATION=+
MNGRIAEAYEEKNGEKSREAHSNRAKSVEFAEELHASSTAGDLVKSLVYGGLDGIITTFAIVSAVAGAGMPTKSVILLGLANLLADGISMGLGDYISEVAERRFEEHEYEREKWEFENFPQGEIEEMIQIYINKGVSEADAKLIMTTLSKYPDVFVRLMCVDELGFIAPDEESECWKNGLVTMLSFDTFGAVPILVYFLFADFLKNNANDLFALAALATALTMFALGVTKASFTKQSKIKSGLIMVFNGGFAASVAFAIGFLLESRYGTDTSTDSVEFGQAQMDVLAGHTQTCSCLS